MNAISDLATGAVELLKTQGALRADVPILFRRPREKANEIAAAVAKQTLGIYVMPPFPTRAMQGVPFVFYEGAELRVRIIEQPALNSTGADAYDLCDDVALALHWKNPGGMLAHPLMLAPRPVELIEDPQTRILDVIFTAVFQLNKS